MATAKNVGRTKGRRTKGYFYRAGRGWYTKLAGRFIPLRYEDGTHIKDKEADGHDVREAHARFLLDKQQAAKVQDQTTVFEICEYYLRDAKVNGAPKTHADRADTLFDFCFGLPPGQRNKIGPEAFRAADTADPERLTPERKQELSAMKLHDGYGKLAVSEFKKRHVTEWLNAHTTWSQSGRRTRIQAVKRAFNFAVEDDLIKANPIRGYRTPKSQPRITYITPEQETALLEQSPAGFWIALKVCIRTGARFGSEFARLTKEHVVDLGDRMEWNFKADEVKNRRKRIVRITDPEIITIVRDQIKRYDKGPIFRNALGNPWHKKSLSLRFRTIRNKLIAQGVEFDPDCCMYSCRHTYAKRILQGYWSGKPTNIETLARLMGNTPQVCRDHYLQWSDIDNDPVWDAA